MSVIDLVSRAWADGTWEDDAACRGGDVELFFSIEEADQAEALEFCEACPVRDRCLETAVLNQEMYGIWGGMLEGDRRRIIRDLRRRQREARKAAAARTDAA